MPQTSIPHPIPAPKDSWWRRITARPEGAAAPDPVSEMPQPAHALIDTAMDSMRRCGFSDQDFHVELVHRRQAPPTLLVELRAPAPIVWEFSAHLELYLIDRVFRHTGLAVGRVVLAPMKVTGLTLAQARAGVRAVWSGLQKPRQAGDGIDPLDLTNP